MKKRYVVKLTFDERSGPPEMIRRGREAAYRRRHAEVLLLVDEGQHGPKLIDREVAERTGFVRCTVEQIRERCVTEGLDSALECKKRSRGRHNNWIERRGPLDQSRLQRCPRWIVHLLRDQLVESDVVESIPHECVPRFKKLYKTLAKVDVMHIGTK